MEYQFKVPTATVLGPCAGNTVQTITAGKDASDHDASDHNSSNEDIERRFFGSGRENPRRARNELEEWIDGDIVHTTSALDANIGIAETCYQSLLIVLRAIWKLVSQEANLLQPRQNDVLREVLGRLVLWTDPFEPGERDQVLNKSDDLRENVIELLIDIANPVVSKVVPWLYHRSRTVQGHDQELWSRSRLDAHAQELSKWIEKAQLAIADSDSYDSESDLESLIDETNDEHLDTTIQSIASISECFMSLLPSLQRASKLLNDAPLTKPLALTAPLRVSDPAYSFVSQVIDKFDDIDLELARRLGQANWERHRRLLKQMHSGSSLDKAMEREQDEEDEGEEEIHAGAQSLFYRASTFYDSGIGSSKPKQSSYAISNASHTSFLSDINNDVPGGLRVPKTPEEVELGSPFRCEICGHTLYNIKNRVDWKMHVFGDLQPYLCIWPECQEGMRTFPTRKLWGNHEFSCHRVERSWRCDICATRSPSKDEHKSHIADAHGHLISTAQLRLAELAQPLTQPSISKDMECPLCKDIAGSTQRAFETHVGAHMEQIALFSLPRESPENSDAESDGSQAEQISESRLQHPEVVPMLRRATSRTESIPPAACIQADSAVMEPIKYEFGTQSKAAIASVDNWIRDPTDAEQEHLEYLRDVPFVTLNVWIEQLQSKPKVVARTFEDDCRLPFDSERQHLEPLLHIPIIVLKNWFQRLQSKPSRSVSPADDAPHKPFAFSVENALCRKNGVSYAEHQNQRRKWACTCCEMSYQSKWDWRRHEEINLFDWPCPIEGCPTVYPRQDKLPNHLRISHGITTHSEFKPRPLHRYFTRHCGLCGKIFTDASAFLDHVALHWDGKESGRVPGLCTMKQWLWDWPPNVGGKEGESNTLNVEITESSDPERDIPAGKGIKLMCPHCKRPDFLGHHELQRHIDRVHSSRRMVWICKDISPDGKFLANCKACRNGKTYGANYNAAAHLRRVHFLPDKKRRNGGKRGSNDGAMGGYIEPSMEDLKHWMIQVEERVDRDTPRSEPTDNEEREERDRLILYPLDEWDGPTLKRETTKPQHTTVRGITWDLSPSPPTVFDDN